MSRLQHFRLGYRKFTQRQLCCGSSHFHLLLLLWFCNLVYSDAYCYKFLRLIKSFTSELCDITLLMDLHRQSLCFQSTLKCTYLLQNRQHFVQLSLCE